MKFESVFYSLLGGSIALAQEEISDEVNRNLNNVKAQVAEGLVPYFQELAVQQGVGPSRAARDLFLYYGCYCFSADNRSAGPRNNYHGPPKDELDNLCYKLYRAQTCLKKDMDENNEGACDPHAQYKTYRDANNVIQCGKNPNSDPNYNTDPANACAMRNCALEQQFVQSVVDLLKTDFEADPDNLKYNKKSGKYLQNCPTPTGNGNGNNNGGSKQCCGDGFNRRPYNDVMHSCCVDGSVTSFGNCP